MAANLFHRFSSTAVLFLSGLAALLIGHGVLSLAKPAAAFTSDNPQSGTAPYLTNDAAGFPAGASSASRPSATRPADTTSAIAANATALHQAGRSTHPASHSAGHAPSPRISDRATTVGLDGRRQAVVKTEHRQTAGIPFSYSIPEKLLVAGSPEEEEALYQAQVRFADELNSVAEANPASAEYAARWNRSAASHDDQLRLFLGGPRYVQLTALAMQAEQTARDHGQ